MRIEARRSAVGASPRAPSVLGAVTSRWFPFTAEPLRSQKCCSDSQHSHEGLVPLPLCWRLARRAAMVAAGAERMKLLVIEDDREAAAYIAKGLSESGYVVDRAADGREGLFMATSGAYDALIVDRMLPQMDGLALIAALRSAEIRTPVLILSALGAVDDRVKGLRAGGDDYLTKPFAFAELLARL